MAARASEETASRRRIPGWVELILLMAGALLLSVVLKAFVVQMFFVPSQSMQPLFEVDDRLLVQKISYWSGDVERGDVVVFEDPGGWLGTEPVLNTVQRAMSVVGLYPTGGHLVKRVVAVGGDEVVCCDDQGRITVNGQPLDEQDYLKQPRTPSDQDFEVRVPEDRLWVMGDNRANSEDSRFHQEQSLGTIPVSAVVGKVWAVVWPADRWSLVDRPVTFDRF